MTILALDPGPTLTAFVELGDLGEVRRMGHVPNEAMLAGVRVSPYPMAIEMIACYGMAVGAEVFETCLWIGRYVEAAQTRPHCVYRQDVKLHLCRSTRANDANVRAALVDRYGPGKEAAIGTKRKPGPCFGVSGDVWAALAVAVTYQDKPEAFPIFCVAKEDV